MSNSSEYESQAWYGNTIQKRRIFEAASYDEAKSETRRWLAGLRLKPPPDQVVLLLGGTIAWATPLPEVV